ncbi:nuclear transcription factor Y subunit beta-like [Eupeodes corollae]|uniref:nuclear transcription factor Y subunit beta-like n=1 Tax=Eupeodes corollae TaxID=290404 RepID=UPI0024934A73|nr:nuclear transcription factor Y subunit beta-like [Eupeodes corollae]
MKHLQCFFIIAVTLTITLAQRVVPGVNPQHYQQQQQQQQYQQQVPQMQYAQPGQVPQMQPIQQQQMQQPPMPQQAMGQQQPMMQQQPMHQQPMMQQPVQQQPMHHQPLQQPIQHDPNAIHHQQQHMAHRPQVLDPSNIQGEKAHIQDHIEVPLDTSKMSEQELQFHYFKMHDSDHNNKLDGCELIKSLIHWHEKGSKEDAHQHEGTGHQDKIFSDEELIALIDPILEMDDSGRDGYIDYPEFIKAQQKAAAQNKVEKP